MATDQVALRWSVPANDGGSPILEYSVEQYDDITGNYTAVVSGLSSASCVDGHRTAC